MLTLQIFSDPNIALPSANPDANADLDFSEMMTVNVLQNLYVPTGTAWRMKHIKNAAITVWSLLASFLTLLDVSVMPPACHGASVTRASSVTNMATVSPWISVQRHGAKTTKFTRTTTILAMKMDAQHNMDVLHQLYCKLVAHAWKDLSETKSAVGVSNLRPVDAQVQMRNSRNVETNAKKRPVKMTN
jgi:hypothetical protein